MLETLRREVVEETGIVGNPHEIGRVLSNLRIPLGENRSVRLILGIYACEIPDDTVVIISDERVEYAWFTPGQAAELLAVKYSEYFCR